MATGQKPEGGGPEIPDLDLGVARPPSAKPSGAGWPAASAPQISGLHVRPDAAQEVTISDAPAKPPRASTRGAAPAMEDYFGSANFDGDHFGGDDGFLAIETSGPLDLPPGFPSFPPPGSLAGALPSRPPAVPSEPAPPASAAGARGTDRRPYPTGVTPPTGSLQIEPAELAELSAYGPPPSLVLLAPAYTFRVLKRRAALRKIIDGLLEEFVAAERSRDRLLADLARDFRAGLPDGSPTARLYAPVAEKEQRVRDEHGALAGTSTRYQQGVAAIEGSMTEAKRALTEVRSTLASRQAEYTAAEENKKRGEAKKKRLYIELSGIVAQAEKAGGAIPAEHAGTVARLEAAIAAQKPELQRVEQTYAAAKAAFEAVREEERRLLAQTRESEKKRRALDAEFEQKIGQGSSGAQAAERATEAALADVGRALLAARTPMGDLELNFFTALVRGDEEVAASARLVERHVRALDAYDVTTYRRGLVVAAALAVMLIVLIAVLAA